jgi:hypothetical protein
MEGPREDREEHDEEDEVRDHPGVEDRPAPADGRAVAAIAGLGRGERGHLIEAETRLAKSR